MSPLGRGRGLGADAAGDPAAGSGGTGHLGGGLCQGHTMLGPRQGLGS